MQTVESVDLKRYAGMWYEIANFPMVFQRNCVGDTTAEYTLHPDGSVGVNNRCRNKDGEVDSASGTATVVEGSNNAKLEVTFLPPSRATTGSSAWTRNTAGPWSARPTASTCGSCRARPSCRRKSWTARWPPPRRRAISWMSCGIRRRSSVHVSPAIIFERGPDPTHPGPSVNRRLPTRQARTMVRPISCKIRPPMPLSSIASAQRAPRRASPARGSHAAHAPDASRQTSGHDAQSPHPGEILRENVIEALGLSVTEAASRLAMSRVALSRVLNGKAGISRTWPSGWSRPGPAPHGPGWRCRPTTTYGRRNSMSSRRYGPWRPRTDISQEDAQRFGTGAHRSPIIPKVARVRSLSGSSSSLTRSK